MKNITALTLVKNKQKDKITTSPLVQLFSSYLTTAEKNALFTSNHSLYSRFQPIILTSLLQYVVAGNQEKVIQILRSRPQLIVTKGYVTDMSGRVFNASAAELARWCGDLRYMAKAMLDILANLHDKPQAERIKALWISLDDTYELNGGLNYRLPGHSEPMKSLAFSLSPLLKALQDFIDTFDTMTIAERQTKWCTNVGAEQFLLSTIYLQHYCNPDVPFSPIPSFDKLTFPRSLEIYNYNSDQQHCARGDVNNDVILGRDFAISRGHATCVGGGEAPLSGRLWGKHAVQTDLVALRACEDRTALDLINFKKELRKPLKHQSVEERKYLHCCLIS